MRTVSFLLALLLYACSTFAQTNQDASPAQTYQITETGKVVDTQAYEDALARAEMYLTPYRKKSVRTNMYFESGLVVELWSVDEMNAMGKSVTYTLDKMAEDSAAETLFELHESGTILAKRKILDIAEWKNQFRPKK